MIAGLIPLLVLAGLIALIVKAVGRRSGEPAEERAGTSVRRFFQYALMYGVLGVVAIGLSGLLSEVLPERGTVVVDDSAALARSLAFVIVGVPAFIGLAAWTRRTLEADPHERTSFGWAAYLTAASLTALWTAAWGAYETLAWAFGAQDFDRLTFAQALVWTPIWVVHWRIAERHGQAPRLRLERLAGSGTGIIALAVAVGTGLAAALGSIYEGVFETTLVADFGNDIARAGAGFAVGAAIWWWYWLRHAAGFEREGLWHAYVLLVGVLGGLVTTVVAGSTALYTLLEWIGGDPVASSAARQFDGVPAMVASAAVGLWVWWYHRAVLRAIPVGERDEVNRIYDYVIAGVGLVAATAGVTTVLVAIFEAIAPAAAVARGESAANTLVAAITMLIVGAPIWWVFWSRIQRLATANAIPELRSTTRRVYLFALFGLGGLVALIALLSLMVVAIEHLIEGRFSGETLREIRVGLALVITMGAVAGYHWMVYRHDREVLPEEVRPVLRDVVLVGSDGADLAAAIHDELGVRVRVWHRLDERFGEFDLPAALSALRAEEHEHVLMVAGPDGVEIVPFEEHE